MSCTAIILCEARVVPHVSRLNRVNRQNTNFLTSSHYDDSIVGGQVVTRIVVRRRESPPDIQRQIAFHDRARRHNGVVKIDLLFPEAKWNDRR